MDARLKKIRRVLAVQEKLHELAEWKLAALTRERHELDADKEALIGALNQPNGLHGLFVEAMAKRLRTLAREGDRVDRARAVQLTRLLEESLALKRTERMTDQARKEYLQAVWKRGFDDILEMLGRGEDASLR